MELTDILLSLIILTVLEVVLGIDNLIFLTIITQKLPLNQQPKARKIGLTLAWISRLLMLASAIWITKLITPLITLLGFSFSGRDLFLLAGGLFLIYKATQEIHLELESEDEKAETTEGKKYSKFGIIIVQIVLLDIIFSLDSILTAIGLTRVFWLMATAITFSIGCMLFASEPLSRFIGRHPSIKMLALSFLMLIGLVLLADAFQFHIPRGYLYFAMGYAFFIEFLNILKRKRRAKKISRVD